MKITIINGQDTDNSIYDSCIKTICRVEIWIIKK